MAIVMVLSSLVFVILLAQETIFNTQIEHRSATAELHALRAYYAAKAGMEINILRVKVYVHLFKTAKPKVEPFRAQMDMVWKFPFQWPPVNLSEPDSAESEANEVSHTSFMKDSSYVTSIIPANSLLDINDIASPVPSLRNWTSQVLQRLIMQLRENNKALSDEISEADVLQILSNIQDWVDPNTQVGEQSTLSENRFYPHRSLPPNRSFSSVEELNQVAGMTDLLYKSLVPFITVYGEKSINMNTVHSPQIVLALHPDMPLEIADAITEKNSSLINDKAFTESTFFDFLDEQGLDSIRYDLRKQAERPDEVPYLSFNAPYNFHMRSVGRSGLVEKTIHAVYLDTESLSKNFYKIAEEERTRMTSRTNEEKDNEASKDTRQANNPPQTNESANNKDENTSEKNEDEQGGPTQKPQIIYWKESSLKDKLINIRTFGGLS